MTRTSNGNPSVHASRAESPMPQGFPLFSRLRSIAPASEGNDDSTIT